MSDTTQTVTDVPNPRICYAAHVEARNTGFVRADYYPRTSNDEGREALAESQRVFARERGIEFDGDER